MSQVYSTEPPTTGRVVLRTSHGPIDLNLWCNECPSATRQFLRLCLDGYYDKSIFHRVSDGFLIQAGRWRYACEENDNGNGKGKGRGVGKGGDDGVWPSLVGTDSEEMGRYLEEAEGMAGVGGNSKGGSTVVGGGVGGFLGRAKLELSARIRFNHRGQVAMALPLDALPSSLSSSSSSSLAATNDETEGHATASELTHFRPQFFITLDETPFLDGKHVVFGTVSGPTIFNALRIGKVPCDEETGMPLDIDVCPPPRILDVKIDHHPFEDLVATEERSLPWKKRRKRNEKDSVEGENGDGEETDVKKRRKRRKGKKDLNVLSFGDEERELLEGEETERRARNGRRDEKAAVARGMKSSHDAVGHESEFLSSAVVEAVKEAATVSARGDKDNGGGGDNIPETMVKLASRKRGRGIEGSDDNDADDARIDNDATETKAKASEESVKENTNRTEIKSSSSGTATTATERVGSGKRLDAHGEDAAEPPPPPKKKISEVEARRAKYLRNAGSIAASSAVAARAGDGDGRSTSRGRAGATSKREEDVMAKLNAFRGRLLKAKEDGKKKKEQYSFEDGGRGRKEWDRDKDKDNDRDTKRERGDPDGRQKRNGDDGEPDLASRMAARFARSEMERSEKRTTDDAAAASLSYRGQVLEEDSADDNDDGAGVGEGSNEEEKDGGHKRGEGGGGGNGDWMRGQFRCRRHIDHSSKEEAAGLGKNGGGGGKGRLGSDGRNTDDYVVIDDRRGGRRGGGRRGRTTDIRDVEGGGAAGRKRDDMYRGGSSGDRAEGWNRHGRRREDDWPRHGHRDGGGGSARY